jgi:hypothetical protein
LAPFWPRYCDAESDHTSVPAGAGVAPAVVDGDGRVVANDARSVVEVAGGAAAGFFDEQPAIAARQAKPAAHRLNAEACQREVRMGAHATCAA